MKYLVFIISFLISLSSYGQKVVGASAGWLKMCDTLTGQTVYLEPESFSGIDDCCYVFDGTNYVKREDCAGIGECVDPVKTDTTLFCKKWSSTIIGIDNTEFGCIAGGVITLTNADGTTTIVEPSATLNGSIPGGICTAQLLDWVVVFGAAYPNLVVEPRCNLVGGCGGLLEPNADVDFQLMKWRYLNMIACPTDDHYPVKAEITGHVRPSFVGRVISLEFDQTPEQRGWLCVVKGQRMSTLLYDDFTEVPQADMPICYFECGEDIPEKPEPLCTFDVIFGCDDLGTVGLTDDVDVYRQLTQCPDGTFDVSYWLLDSLNQVVNPYSLTGNFTDCNGGIIEDPEIDCEIIGLSVKCFTKEVIGELLKAGVQVSDCDSGAANEGEQNCGSFSTTVDATILSVESYSTTNSSVTIQAPVLSNSDQTATFQYCWTQTGGTTPTGDISVTLNTSKGGVTLNTDSSSDFVLCSGGGESLNVTSEGSTEEIELKEICFNECPNEYQDSEGNIVDTSGLSICFETASTDFEVNILCRIDDSAVNGIIGKRWDSELNAAPHNSTSVMFSDWSTHINGAADEEVVITDNWSLNDLDFPVTGPNDGDISSQELYYATIYVDEPIQLYDNNGNKGEQLRFFLQDCNKDMLPVAQTETNTNGNNLGLGYITELCEGFHKIAIQVSDYSVYGGFILRYSTDDGATLQTFPMSQTFTSRPKIISEKIYCYSDGTMTYPDGTPYTFTPVNCSYPCYPLSREPLPDVEVNLIPFCDDVTGDPADYVNATLEVITLNGDQSSTAYTNYGDDNTQAEYTIQGTAVDCATGEPIVTPPIIPDCEDVEFLTAFAPKGTQGVNVERWINNAITGEPVSTTALDIFNGAVDYSGMPAHDNGAPDGPIVIESDLLVRDPNNAQDQFRYWTYMYVTEPIRLRDRAAWAEATAYYLGECCVDPTLNVNGPYPNTGTTPFDVTLQPGIHYVGGTVFDFSAFSGVDYQYSTDNGVTWARVPTSWLYSEKPVLEECIVKACIQSDGSFLLTDAETGEILGSEFSLKKPQLCSGAIALASDPQCAPQTFYKINEDTPNGVNVQYWGDNAAAHDNVSNIFTDFDTHVNGVADGVGVNPNWNFNDGTVATLTGANQTATDQILAYAYIYLEEDALLQETNTNTGEKGSVWIGECCGDNELIYEVTDNTFTPDRGLFGEALSADPPISLPAGLHWIGFQLSDLSASGGITLRYSTDGGITYALFPFENTYTVKPPVSTIKGWYCSDGNNYNQDRSEVLDDTYLCKDPRCNSSCTVKIGE